MSVSSCSKCCKPLESPLCLLGYEHLGDFCGRQCAKVAFQQIGGQLMTECDIDGCTRGPIVTKIMQNQVKNRGLALCDLHTRVYNRRDELRDFMLEYEVLFAQDYVALPKLPFKGKGEDGVERFRWKLSTDGERVEQLILAEDEEKRRSRVPAAAAEKRQRQEDAPPPPPPPASVVVEYTMQREKETKGFVVYKNAEGAFVYVRKADAEGMGNPNVVTVKITPK